MKSKFTNKFRRKYRFYFGPFTDRRVGVFFLRKRGRNVFLTVTDLTGAVVQSLSSKFFVADRKKRLAPHVTEALTARLCMTLKAHRVNTVRIILRMSKRFIVSAVARALRANDIAATVLFEMNPIAHNGCRRRKSRRL